MSTAANNNTMTTTLRLCVLITMLCSSTAFVTPLSNHPNTLLLLYASSPITTPTSTTTQNVDMTAYANGFKTVYTELPFNICKVIEGKIPDDLQGSYFRAGPAMFSAGSIVPPKKSIVQPKQPPVPDNQDPDRMVKHYMEGDGGVLGITITRAKSEDADENSSSDDSNNEATVISRFRYVRTIGFTAERKKGARIYTGMDSTRSSASNTALGNDLPVPLFRHHLLPGLNKLRKNTSNTRAVYWGKRLLSLWEGGQPYKLDALAVSTEGKSRLGGAIKKEADPFGCKVVYDNVKNRALFYAVDATPIGSTITLYEFNQQFQLVNDSPKSIKTSGYAVLNDMGATENYGVFIQPNIKLNGMKFVVDQAPGSVLTPQAGSTLHLVGRIESGRSDLSINIPASAQDGDFIDANIHFCNAYEKGDSVVIDVIRSSSSTASATAAKWPWASTLQDYQSTASKKSLWRYIINTKSKSVEKRLLTDQYCAFGTVNPSVSTREHQYVYFNHGSMGSEVAPPQGITKFDCNTGTMTSWMPETYEFCGEPMFACKDKSDGNDNNSEEDNGYILSVLFNGKEEKSELVILDAKNIENGPITRIDLGIAIPHGLFGCFTNSPEAKWSLETIERRAKLADKVESRGNMWNEVKSDFSGMGLRLDDMEEYFGDWNPFA